MDINSLSYFGFSEYFCGETIVERDDPEDPIIICVKREYYFKIGPYIITISPVDTDAFVYTVKDDQEVIFDSKGHLKHPTYQQVVSMLKYYDALTKQQDCTFIIAQLYPPHAALLNGKELHNMFEIVKSITTDDIQDLLSFISEELGKSPNQETNPHKDD